MDLRFIPWLTTFNNKLELDQRAPLDHDLRSNHIISDDWESGVEHLCVYLICNNDIMYL